MVKKGKTGKQKTSSSAKKRFRKTGTGKFIHNKPAHNHLLQHKSKKQKRLARKNRLASGAYGQKLKRLMPNG